MREWRCSSLSNGEQIRQNGRGNEHETRTGRRRNITLGPSRRCPRIVQKHTPHSDRLEPPLIEEEEVMREPKGMLIVHRNNGGSAGRGDDPRPFNANVKDDSVLSTSHATAASIAGNYPYYSTYNQSSHNLIHNSPNLARLANSAETYFLASSTRVQTPARPKALTNPFAPASIRIPMVPGRRRWAHTFPMGMRNRIACTRNVNRISLQVPIKYPGIFITYVKLRVPWEPRSFRVHLPVPIWFYRVQRNASSTSS